MRSKRLPSRSIKVNKLLPDLPEEIIIEILIQLPRNSLAQWKCVSKRWYTLISDPNFLTSFLCHQNEMKTPIESGMIFTDYNFSKYYSFTTLSELPKSVKHSLEEREGCCTVLATYNDLVLCFRENHYNICNLHTMQQVALPPTRPRHDYLDVADVGFICEPYYKEDDSPSRSTIILNDEYRCRVVIIYKVLDDYSFQFCIWMDIFFSETGEWREFFVRCPGSAGKYFTYDNGAQTNSYNNSGGIAYNGKLYWLGEGGIMELDPLAFDSNTSYSKLNYPYCRFIQFRVFGNHRMGKIRLDVCRGRMCLMSCQGEDFKICRLESRDDDQLAGGKWCFKLTHWSTWITDNPWLLSLDSFDEDCFYMISRFGYFGKGNMRTRKTNYDSVKRCNGAGSWESFGAFQFVLPWWPTPVPKIKQPVPNGIDILCNLLLDP